MSRITTDCATDINTSNDAVIEVKPKPITALYWVFAKVLRLLIYIGILIAMFNFNMSTTNQSLPAGLTKIIQPVMNTNAVYILLAVAVLAYFWFRSVVKAYDYKVTDSSVVMRYGLLSMNTRTIPISQITDINIRCSILERLFGIASVRVNCIGTALQVGRSNRAGNNTTRMEGLTMAECEKVSDYLTKKMSK
ncbi:MAG: PH domain-containing protein [Coxiellaceae bacterium]|nr:PH domain-containing protein [Coxiellaceae bacterium]